MGFTEIEQTKGKIKSSGVDAIYRVNNKGVGTLRFTRAGSEKLSKIKGLDLTKLFKLYVDKETKDLAFKQTEDGQFKLSGKGKNAYTLSYSDLSKEIKEMVRYMIEESKGYSFVLNVVKDSLAGAAKTSEVINVETSEPITNEVKEEENKPKKGRGKKK